MIPGAAVPDLAAQFRTEPSGADRIAALERQVAELVRHVEGLLNVRIESARAGAP